ncbi:MAG: alpha/beta hydrolase [Myxococcota bacterium]
MVEHRIEIMQDMLLRRGGRAGSTKLICLHGFGDSGLMFLPLLETALAEHFELVLVDLPGFGASPPKSGALVADYGRAVAELASALAPGASVGLVGHSIAAAIAVAATDHLSSPPVGVASLEGNLTMDDAFFTGMAADWPTPEAFKDAFLDALWTRGGDETELRRYFAGAVMGHAPSMWALGRDAKRVSAEDAVGHAYRRLKVPSLYYWSKATTPERTQRFIETHQLSQLQYSAPSHWPSVADPSATGQALSEFFRSCSR